MRRLTWPLVVAVLAFSNACDPEDANDPQTPVVNPPPTPPVTEQPGPLGLLVSSIADGERSADVSGRVVLAADATVNPADAVYTWDFGDGGTAVGVNVDHQYAAIGCFRVGLTVSRTGEVSATSYTQAYVAGALDASTPATATGLPSAGARLPRTDATVRAVTRHVTGTLPALGWQVQITVTEEDADDDTTNDVIVSQTSKPVCTTAGQFDVAFPIPASLHRHSVHAAGVSGAQRVELASTSDIIVGDVIIIQGQSNAQAANYSNPVPVIGTHPFVLSFGSASTTESASTADNVWHVANQGVNGAGTIGQWAQRMALDIVAVTNIPLFVINGSDPGKAIAFFQRNDANHVDTSNNYGRLLSRMRDAGLDHAVRAILYYQGEQDGAAGETHRVGFTALFDDWHDDYPSIEHLYVTQVRNCSSDAGSLPVQEVQRRFQNAGGLAHTTTMSVMGIDGHNGCHYYYTNGYEELGHTYSRLVLRDLYGIAATDVRAIDVTTAVYSASANTVTIGLEGDYTTLTIETGNADKLADHMKLLPVGRTITSTSIDGNSLVLHLNTDTATVPTEAQYWGHRGTTASSSGSSVINAKGVGLLAFDIPVTH